MLRVHLEHCCLPSGKKNLKAEQDRRQHFHFHNQFHITSSVRKMQQLSKMNIEAEQFGFINKFNEVLSKI